VRLDLVIENARIVTVDERRPQAGTVGVLNGTVVGLDEEISGLPARQRVDAGGAVVVPGFHDAHNHMAGFGVMLTEIDAGGMDSVQQLTDAIRDVAHARPDQAWIVASGYDQIRLGSHPSRADLDRTAPGRCVVVHHRTNHMLVASTAALRRAGLLSAGYRVPEGGFVERDPVGEPTGLVGEQAMLAFRSLMRPVSIAELSVAIRRAAEIYLSEGITSVCEAGVGNSAIVGSSPVELGAYQAAREQGLPVRVQLMVAMENLRQVDAHPDDGFDIGLDLGIRSGFGDDHLSIGALKMFTDGALSSRTAALSSPFCDHGGKGLLQFDPERLTRTAVAAHRAGWQLAIHAIGDRAVDLALDMIQTADAAHPRPDARHRIEHASVVRPDQLQRFARLGVIASIQPRFVTELGDGVAAGLGEQRMGWTYRHASFAAAGLVVAGGSDRPVAAGAPLLGMQAMMQRRTASGREFGPQEAVTGTEALRCYTVHPAYAARQEATKGRIAPGHLADFAVLDDDPTTAAAERIGDIAVLATVVDGRFRFDPGGLGG
jgi:predicted amidohydrolase YtcJ